MDEERYEEMFGCAPQVELNIECIECNKVRSTWFTDRSEFRDLQKTYVCQGCQFDRIAKSVQVDLKKKGVMDKTKRELIASLTALTETVVAFGSAASRDESLTNSMDLQKIAEFVGSIARRSGDMELLGHVQLALDKADELNSEFNQSSSSQY